MGTLIPLRTQDRKPSGRAKTQHRPHCKDQVVQRQAQVEHRDAVRTGRSGDKKGVSQDVAGCTQKAENIQKHIVEKLMGELHSRSSLFTQ